MSITARAASFSATPFNVLFWSPFALVAALSHASQTYDGAKMRWWQADSDDMTETLSTLQTLCNG